MNKKVVVLGILAVCLSISIGIGFSYALWNQTEIQEGTNRFQSGCFSISYKDDNNIINFNNAYPIPDEKGIQQKAYTFTITNTCSIYAHFSVNLEKLAISDMEDQYIKLQLNNRRPMLYSAYNAVTTALDNTSSSRSLDFGGLEPEAERTYSLRLWIDNEATNDQVGGKSFQALISVVSAAAEPTGAEYIENLLATNKETMANDDPDENVRYIGATPNNYVTFNNEPWRIIGVFDTFECDDEATASNYQSQCSTKKLLKIIRNDSIGAYSWDSSDSNVNGGFGINEWSTAAIQKALNEAYYNSQKGICYYTSNKAIKECDFSQTSMKGLDETARNQVARVMWSTGTLDKDFDSHNSTATAQIFYNAERSNYNGKICTSGERCTDKVPRTTKWIGKVGLMYPSDYGYSIGHNQRIECFAESLSSYNNCGESSWLLHSYDQWTITSIPSWSGSGAIRLRENGFVDHADVYGGIHILPVVYLKSNVQITGGKGTEKEPYTLSTAS